MSSNPPIMQHTNPLGPDGIVRCKHGEQAQRFISQTLQNPNRPFYKCSREGPGKCNFYLWEDKLNNPPSQPPMSPAPAPSSKIASGGLSTPRSTPFHSAASTSTLQSTPVKRNRSEGSMDLASANTPSKKARLEAIQAGLRARNEDQSPNQPAQPTVPEEADALPFTHGAEAESPASDTTTEFSQEVEPRPVRYSFLGLPPSQGSESGAVLRTPKKRPSSILDGNQGLFGSSSALLTPPQTIKQTHCTEAFDPSTSAGGSSRPEPVTPTRNKGKERASARFDEFVQSQEYDNPFVDTPSLSFKCKLTSDASFDTHSQGSSSVPTTGERITADMREMLGTINTLRVWAERFAVLDPLQYIERLERQRSSLEVADAAKKKRIEELVEEIHRKDELIAHLQGGQR